MIGSSWLIAPASRPIKPMWRTGWKRLPMLEPVAIVRYDARGIEFDAPGVEQPAERRRRRGPADPEARRVRPGENLGVRVDEDERSAAAHDELIDRVQRAVVEHCGVHDPEHVDVLVDRENARGQRPPSSSCFACSTTTHGCAGCCEIGSKPPPIGALDSRPTTVLSVVARL